MDGNADLQVSYAFDVPFIWRDERQGRERLAVTQEVMPVRIRGVPKGYFRTVIERIPGTDHAVRVARSKVDGETWSGLHGILVAKLLEPGARPLDMTFSSHVLPYILLPTREQARRNGAAMRAAAVSYPLELAAARVARILEADVVHDGTCLYQRHVSRDPARSFDIGNAPFNKILLDVLEAGERALRARPYDVGLAERMARLRRDAVTVALGAAGREDVAGIRSRIGAAAEAVAASHPTERVRKRMTRILDACEILAEKGIDDDDLAILAP